MNKKIIGLLSIFAVAMILAPSLVLAVDIGGTEYSCVGWDTQGNCPTGYSPTSGAPSATPCCKLATGGGGTDLPDVAVEDALNRITNYAFYSLLLVAVLMLIVAAWMFVTAGSNPETVKTARKMLMMALIGLAVAILAKGTVALVRTIIEGN